MSFLRAAAVQIALAAAVLAWNMPPHRAMTQAALDSVLPEVAARIGPYAKDIVETYCLLPDRYVEIEQFGFARKGPGPRDLEELKPFCVRPDGALLHSASFDHDDDLGSIIYLYERILTTLSEKKQKEMAMYLGVLAHFIEDSLSPPHSVSADDLNALAAGQTGLHGALERSVPSFAITKRKTAAYATVLEGLEAILARLYAAADANRKALPDMVRAVESGDQQALDAYRLKPAKEASELLADALNLILSRR